MYTVCCCVAYNQFWPLSADLPKIYLNIELNLSCTVLQVSLTSQHRSRGESLALFSERPHTKQLVKTEGGRPVQTSLITATAART